MEIVLPLAAVDLDRYLRLQRPSFERHYADLDRTSIITGPGDVDVVRAATAELAGVVVVDERSIVPEAFLLRPRLEGGRNWYLQQLIKLSAVHAAATEFALVLDADVIAVRGVSDADLVRDGRALRPRNPRDTHPDWVEQAATALRVEALDYSASVTPSVLSREAVQRLALHATTLRSDRPKVRAASAVPGLRRRLTSWRGRLIGRLPWTEYQLYDTFLQRCDHFDEFHVVDPDVTLYGNCVWDREAFAAWRPSRPDSPFFFSVLQGALGIPIAAIEAKLRG
jgi:hypothetical protein